MTEQEECEYIKFINNRDNVYKCEKCPNNE